jgi:hypothetical protein
LTRIKCPSDDGIWFKCRFLKDGYCSKDKIEMEFALDGPGATTAHMECADEDRIRRS